MQNYKNRLQEIFQKIGLGLPKYESSKKDDRWICTVELCTGSRFTGRSAVTKIESDQDAARQAILYYEGHKAEFNTEGLIEAVTARSQWMEENDINYIRIMVDLENIGDEKQFKKLETLRNRGFIIEGYASCNYKHSDKAKKYLHDSQFTLTKSDMHESVDVAIIIDIENILIQGSASVIFIVSYDKITHAAADMFNQQMDKYSINAHVYHCRTIDQVLVMLNSN